MNLACRRIAATLLVLAAHGCATPFKSIPKSDDDFRLPPAELTQRFTDVRQYSAEHASVQVFNFPVAEELISNWGPPDKSTVPTVNRTLQYGMVADFSGIALWASGGVLDIFLPATVFIGYMMLTQTPEKLTWNKADYSVDVHTVKQSGAQRVLSWDWKHTSSGVTTPVFASTIGIMPVVAPDVGITPIFKYDLSFGPRFFESDFDANDPGLNGGFSLGIGVRHPTLIPRTDTEISVGWRTNGNFDYDSNRQTNTNLTIGTRSIPIEALAMYRVADSSMRVGGGVSAHLNGRFLSNYLPDEKLDPAVGFIGQFDYSFFPRSATGIRFEWLRYQTASGRELNANTIGLTHTTAFR